MQRMLVILIKEIPNLALYWISYLNLCVIMEFCDFNSVTSGLSLALVHSSTNMLKSVWVSDFWKPLVHINMSKISENIEEIDDNSD